MLDIIAFLVQEYRDFAACPEPEHLAQKLSAVGFEDEEIDDALDWLAELAADEASPIVFAESTATRMFSASECEHLPVDTQGFIHFLDTAGALTNLQREQLIDRLMALPSDDLDLDAVRLATLAVLWRHAADIDILVADELMVAIDGQPPLQ